MKEVITLVPHSGVQFVDAPFDLDQTPRFSRTFIERPDPNGGDDIFTRVRLYPGWNELDPDGEAPKRSAGDVEYDISKQRALEPFLGKWVPVPYLRVKAGRGADGQEVYDEGPTNWVRVRVVERADRQRGSGPSHHAVFAFDTELAERFPNRPYTAPEAGDAENSQEFRFVTRMSAIGWFLSNPKTDSESGQAHDFQSWVLEWLWELFREFKEAQRPGRPFKKEDLEYPLEFAARYFAFLEFLGLAVKPATVRFIDTVSKDPPARPVGVDLILDVGNSRTCGLLIERFPNEDAINLGNSMVLELRDLGRPEIVYDKPFESHVELVAANFGREELSRESGRSKAFFWPGMVRVGPEAARYREQAEGTEALSGMSSPKRYLWDVAAANQDWKFNAALGRPSHVEAPIEKAVRRFINPRGDVRGQIQQDRVLFQKKLYGRREAADLEATANRFAFSRSSFFGFMIAEIVWQAMVMINSPGVRARRGQKDLPRRLERIFFTLPTATSVREQRIMKMRAESAVKLIWDLMGWKERAPPHLNQPSVHLNLDEASCVQFVYLYGEIARKFGGAISQYFEIAGRRRPYADVDQVPAPDAQPEPSLRIASIDIGGGTSDLMITTYYGEGDRAIRPVQTFREGFRIAGDDILKEIIQRHVLRGIEARLTECGLRSAREFLKERFDGDRGGMAEQDRHLRRQVILRLLVPLGLAMLHAYEKAGAADLLSVRSLGFAELLELGGQGQAAEIKPRLAAYLEKAASERGAQDFTIESCRFTLDFSEIGRTVQEVLRGPLGLFAEAIHHFDCDVVLLTGRPSCLPSVVDFVNNRLAVSPDRIVPLHMYRPGQWYPFRGLGESRIVDPKTTAAVGCMLCALADRQLTNFSLYSKGLTMRSTARFIGDLELDFRLREDKVIFRADDLLKPGEASAKEIRFHGKTRIGFRQLPFERWTATPLYMLKLDPGSHSERIENPLTVTLERESPEEADLGTDKFLDAEAQKEELKIVEAKDNAGADLSRIMSLSLNTLADEDGYWLDTGVLTVP